MQPLSRVLRTFIPEPVRVPVFFVASAYETPGWQEVVKTASDFVMYNAPRILGLSASGIIAFGVAGKLIIMR